MNYTGNVPEYARPDPTYAAPVGVPQVNVPQKEVGECAICFDELCSRPVVFLSSGRSRCAHYFHSDCAQMMSTTTRQCPICRTPFSALINVPANPSEWFNVIDVDGSGTLSAVEILGVFMATTNYDWRALEAGIRAQWPIWDADRSGCVSRAEFLNSVLPWISANIRRAGPRAPPPHPKRDPQGWFRYFDEDQSGHLDAEEVVRALSMSVLPHTDLSTLVGGIEMFRSIVAALWADFDADGSGTLTYRELFLTGGLIDTVLANAPGL